MSNENLSAADPEKVALIKQAGLEKTALNFPEDVAVAMKTAASARAALADLALNDNTAEPWPPMRVRGVV